MKRHPDLYIYCLSVILLGFCVPVALAKPLSPVQVSIAPLHPTTPDAATVELVVRATVSVDAHELKINVSLPAGVQLTGGQTHWQGTLLKGQEKRINFSVSINNSLIRDTEISADKLIHVQALIVGQGNSQLSANALYRWGASINRAAALSEAPPSRVVERYGRKIQEYEVRP